MIGATHLRKEPVMIFNVIIIGATGMVGKAVLLECLDSADVTSVLSSAGKQRALRMQNCVK
jgi:nucleoside-diphosphate-sugar epimerase